MTTVTRRTLIGSLAAASVPTLLMPDGMAEPAVLAGPVDLWYRQMKSEKPVLGGNTSDVYYFTIMGLDPRDELHLYWLRTGKSDFSVPKDYPYRFRSVVAYQELDRAPPDGKIRLPGQHIPQPGDPMAGLKLATLQWTDHTIYAVVVNVKADDTNHKRCGSFFIALDGDNKILFPWTGADSTAWDGCKFELYDNSTRTWMWFSLEPHRDAGGPTQGLC